jgi:hypothetical protein
MGNKNLSRKKCLISSHKKTFPGMLSQSRTFRKSKFGPEIDRNRKKESEFFSNNGQGIQGFDLGQKKFQNISCLCTFKETNLKTKVFEDFFKV